MTIENVNNSHVFDSYKYYNNFSNTNNKLGVEKNELNLEFDLKLLDDEQTNELKEIAHTAANEFNNLAKVFNRSIKFQVHEDTGRIKTEVIDTTTNEVIREIPCEKMLDIISKLKTYVGTLVDKQL